MKRLLVIGIGAVVALLVMSSVASAGTYTFSSRDLGGTRSDFEDLDHTKAYLWAFHWQPAAGEVITGATLSFSSIYNWDDNKNWLGIYLIKDKLPTGGTTGWSAWSSDRFGNNDLTPDTAVFQKSDGPDGTVNVAKPFDTVVNKVLVGAYSDTRHGSVIKDSPVFDFAHPELKSASTPTWGWSIYNQPLQASALDELSAWSADGNWALGIDPDCHFYNRGVILTITTGQPTTNNDVPEPISMVLGALGLGMVAGFKRRRKA